MGYTGDTIKYTMDIDPQTECSVAPCEVPAAERSLCLLKIRVLLISKGGFAFFFRVFLLCLYGGESFCSEKSKRGKKEMKENKKKVREGERKKRGGFVL